jgi:glycosyltransferase involved in cell wall biosynthesis
VTGSPPLRVVTLVNRIGRQGGAERLAVELAAGLAGRGHDSTLCVSRRPPEEELDEHQRRQETQVREAGGRVLGLTRRSKVDLASWRPLMALLRRERTQVLHAHMVASNAWATVLGGLAGVPVIVSHEHTWSYAGRPLRRLVDRHLIARGSDAFVAVSGEDRRKMIEVEGVRPDDAVVIPNGIPDPPPPTGADVRAGLGLAPGQPLLVAFGRLDPQKGFDVLVEAASRVPGAAVVIAGEGGERAALEALVSRLGLQDRVRLPGFRGDVPDLVAAADAAVFPSRFEGSPLSVIECMAAGAAIVATPVGGVPELLEDGRQALFVPADDAGALAEALTRLIGDPALRAELGARARERQQAEFGLDAMLDRVSALYDELWQQACERAGYPLPPLSAGDRLRRLAGR